MNGRSGLFRRRCAPQNGIPWAGADQRIFRKFSDSFYDKMEISHRAGYLPSSVGQTETLD